MSLKDSLGHRPVIYEIVPPRRDSSRFNTELAGVERVLSDPRIVAINIPELITRRYHNGATIYSPATIPPEEYALMIREYKEPIVNMIAPRLEKDELLRRTKKVLHEYRIPNLVVVGRERHEDVLPGPNVIEALNLLGRERTVGVALGGICIFTRKSSLPVEYGNGGLWNGEPYRVWLKATAGCDFVTGQITFDSKPILDFLSSYQSLCEQKGTAPVTVFVSLTTVPSTSILSLLDSLDVVIPPRLRKRLIGSSDIGRESVRIATEVFEQVITRAERNGIKVKLGLQIEQIGVNNSDLSLSLLDRVYPELRAS